MFEGPVILSLLLLSVVFLFWSFSLKIEIWPQRRRAAKWVYGHFLKRSFHTLECRAQRCSLRPIQQDLSPLGAALWKAKKYILFDWRFGSLGNYPGTLFTAHKTCLPHGKDKKNFFFQAKKCSLSHYWSPPSPFSSLTLWSRDRGHSQAWLQRTEAMKWVQGCSFE